MSKPAQLCAVGVSKLFGSTKGAMRVLQGVSVTFEQGTTYALTGTSGVGKSTLIHLLAGVDTPSTGRVELDSVNVATGTPTQLGVIRMQRIGLVFQSAHLLRELSVLENVMLPGLIAGIPEKQCVARARSLLKRVGLDTKRQEPPASLSGGQQQRLALARALCNKPDFLLADEPTGNLDAANGRAIVDLMLELQHTEGMGIVVSTHDPHVSERMDVVYELTSRGLKKI